MKLLDDKHDPAHDLFYEDLRRAARWLMKSERRSHTLDATALVHEALLQILGNPAARDCEDPRKLRRIIWNAMRWVLIDSAKRRRPESWPAEWIDGLPDPRTAERSDLRDALGRLEKVDPRSAEAVTLRYFYRMRDREVARLLGVAVKTVEADLRFARAWLRRELTNGD